MALVMLLASAFYDTFSLKPSGGFKESQTQSVYLVTKIDLASDNKFGYLSISVRHPCR